MNTARECGITVPETRLINGKYFACERFDIKGSKRLHTATAAALLKSDFQKQNQDYTNLLALTGYLTQDPHDVEQMYRIMVFNIVADNKDDHAKNFSFINDGSRWHLAPAYDLTYSPKGLNGQHATSVFYNGNPTLENIFDAGTRIRIPKQKCLDIIKKTEEICDKRLPKTSPVLTNGEQDFPKNIR